MGIKQNLVAAAVPMQVVPLDVETCTPPCGRAVGTLRLLAAVCHILPKAIALTSGVVAHIPFAMLQIGSATFSPFLR